MIRITIKVPDSVRRFSADPAVRVGVLHAAYSVAPSYHRGLLPRSAGQQAVVNGVNASSYYMIGTTGWSLLSSLYAGFPGHRAGWRALLIGSGTAVAAGALAERRLRPVSGDSMALATAWAAARFTGTIGLAGGLVILSDVVAERVLGHPAGIRTTLALDVGGGVVMAAGTVIRRNRRKKKYQQTDVHPYAVIRPKKKVAYLTIAGISVGTVAGIAGLAVAEQATARAIHAATARSAGTELGETGTLLAHAATAGVAAVLAGLGLNEARRRTKKANQVIEPAYPAPPVSEHVSCGPNSSVDFDRIGKEGRRFVLMTLSANRIQKVMSESAIEPVRIVIPRPKRIKDPDSIAERVELTISEMAALGAFERSLIVIASPTGVGYVNYVMAEALEYLTRGDCATVVPQYALVPSALALDRTGPATELQTEILRAVRDRLLGIPADRRPRLVQFGESLGAQVALDVAAGGGINLLDNLTVDSGLYLGVPFRSRAWHIWRREPDAIDPDHSIVNVTEPSEAPDRARMHLMVIHNDDPVNKFAYTMFVRRPWWLGRPEDRPPMVPREVLFRPVVTFVITLIDLLNAMNSRPGEFKRIGHDYRIDLRGALEKAYRLRCSPEQAERIEQALRDREQAWATKRLFANAADQARNKVRRTLHRWGQDNLSAETLALLADSPRAGVRQLAETLQPKLPNPFDSTGGAESDSGSD